MNFPIFTFDSQIFEIGVENNTLNNVRIYYVIKHHKLIACIFIDEKKIDAVIRLFHLIK